MIIRKCLNTGWEWISQLDKSKPGGYDFDFDYGCNDIFQG